LKFLVLIKQHKSTVSSSLAVLFVTWLVGQKQLGLYDIHSYTKYKIYTR